MMTLLEKRQNNTDSFLTSYEIREKMSTVSGYDETLSQETSAAVSSAPVKEFNSDLQCGQVRLLADIEEITYVLLLQKQADDTFLVTPFSHYNFPATDKELALGCYAGAFLNVLQIWNTRTLQNSTLEKSWICGEVTEKVCNEVLQFFSYLQNGTALAEDILARTGTAVESEDDVRCEYMRKAESLFDRLDAAGEDDDWDFSLAAWDDSRLIIPRLWQQDEFVLAAGEEKEALELDCSIDGRTEQIKVMYSADEAALQLTVYDNGKRTTSLDKAEVVDVNAKVLGVISEGKVFITGLEEFDGCFALRFEDGEIVLLSSKQE